MKQFILLLLIFSAQTANADIDQSMDKLCAKTKSCGIAELEKQGISGDMVNMMSVMFDGMCKGWLSPYASAVGEAGLEGKAEACIDSMVEQSCQLLMESEGEFVSESCEEFKMDADEAGILGTDTGVLEAETDDPWK